MFAALSFNREKERGGYSFIGRSGTGIMEMRGGVYSCEVLMVIVACRGWVYASRIDASIIQGNTEIMI